jgi:hypothetical protein
MSQDFAAHQLVPTSSRTRVGALTFALRSATGEFFIFMSPLSLGTQSQGVTLPMSQRSAAGLRKTGIPTQVGCLCRPACVWVEKALAIVDELPPSETRNMRCCTPCHFKS